MLLSLTHHHRYPSPSGPPKPITTHSPPKTLTFPTLKITPHSPIRCSSQKLPQSAIQRIADKLYSLGFSQKTPNPNPKSDGDSSNAGEIFIPLPGQLSKYRVGHTLDPSWSTPENPVPRPGSGPSMYQFYRLRRAVKREYMEENRRRKEAGKVPTLAELSLSEEELRRLRGLGIKEKRKLKVGKAGVTEGVVNGIHERWRRTEVVKIVCEDLCKMNMRRTHDLLERKTGGMVVWRSGSKIVLYRGSNYKYPYFVSDSASSDKTSPDSSPSLKLDSGGDDKLQGFSSSKDAILSSGPSPTMEIGGPSLVNGVGHPNRVRFQLPGEAQLAEEFDRLLDGLGPRFSDWWGYDPLPVDADLLPAVVPGFRKPFRLLPYGVKSTLTNDEMTTLKRFSRPLPCHFALGRNRRLQGLAASMVKLWEKCEIAKIAVKRGVQNTNSELMAEELKSLTGGTLLARDREFMVFYRGKDFLPSAVSCAIKERKKHGTWREKQRDNIKLGESARELTDSFVHIKSREESNDTNDHSPNLLKQWKLRSTEAAIKRTSIKLSMALEKKEKAEKLLTELEKLEIPQQPDVDKEGITEDERYMLRKVGLRMKPFLLMGQRGVFDGTIENMHLHWKYRELVKIICKEKRTEAIQQVAQTLEAESGGILVAVERVSKGYAIIVYRGKNYRRPTCLRPPTLLNKKQALKQSLEEQRRQSLKLHVLKLTRNINDLKHQMAKDQEAHNIQVKDEKVVDMASSEALKHQVKEEIKSTESSSLVRSDSLLMSDDHSYPLLPSCYKETLQDMNDQPEADSNDQPEADSNLKAIEEDLIEFSVPAAGQVNQTIDKNENFAVAKEAQFLSCSTETLGFWSTDNNFSQLYGEKPCVSNKEVTSSLAELSQLTDSFSTTLEEETVKHPAHSHLSNKERLLLRRQALKMKKRPVLALGRNNIVTGLAKAIKAHFERYPLAIVNVKGRAKGTSVQEVVFKLEQETGAVLVSREPSKVILYRGWGAEDEPFHKGKGKTRYVQKPSMNRDSSGHRFLSPNLMAAIRAECGLQLNEVENPVN